ncbi:MAG TPA: hypothetical protein VGM37_19780 [Armatimonadota bacterium]|jgi:hypothetical protein
MARQPLPGADKAWVPDDKLTKYILTPNHLKGGSRAAFLAAHGFDLADTGAVRLALLDHARRNPAFLKSVSDYGELWNVWGPLATPDGTNPVVTVGWLDRGDGRGPQFSTLLPRPPRGNER